MATLSALEPLAPHRAPESLGQEPGRGRPVAWGIQIGEHQSPDAARSVARKLLTGRLVFTPGVDAQGPYYQVTGAGKLDNLILPAVTPRGYQSTQSATGVAAPTGFEPVFAVRHALS